jgi:hypothetical protein
MYLIKLNSVWKNRADALPQDMYDHKKSAASGESGALC